MKEVSEVNPDLPAANIIVCIAASIKPDHFKTLTKIESDCICIVGLCFQNDCSPSLPDGDFLGFIHQHLSDALSPQFLTHP